MTPAAASADAQPQDLSNLSIEELANLEVRSVSKRAEPLSVAPAALYVIDHDQIVRSGAVTTPEILRDILEEQRILGERLTVEEGHQFG